MGKVVGSVFSKFVTRSLIVAGSLIAIVPQVYGKVSYTAIELAELNENQCKSNRSIELHFTKESLSNNHRVAFSSTPIHWGVSGDRERLLYDSTESAPNQGDPVIAATIRHDWYYDGTNLYHLSGSDLGKQPASVVEASQLNIKATLQTGFEEEYRSKCPVDSWLLMRGFPFRFTNEPLRHQTFRAFVRDNEATSPVQSLDTNGDTLWTFQVAPRGDSEQRVVVVVNESKGFLIQSLKHEANGSPVNSDIVVLEYANLGGGKFFPEKVANRIYKVTGKPDDGAKIIYAVDQLKVNESLSEDLFAFAIPEFVEVTRYPPVAKNGETYFVISIWGSNNKPARTFSEPGEHEAYIQEQLHQLQSTESTSEIPESTGFPFRRAILATTGFAIIVLSYFVAKKYLT